MLAYVRQWLRARRTPLEFSLRRSEAAELDRALVLYERSSCRLEQIDDRLRKRQNLWRLFFASEIDTDRDEAHERADLHAHTQHLRTVIVRLRRLPLQRLQAWTRLASLRSAFGCALTLVIELFVLFMVLLHWPDPIAGAQNLLVATQGSLHALPYGQDWLLANAAAACLSVTSMPLFYLSRRAALRRALRLEFCLLKELAKAGPEQRWAQDEVAREPEQQVSGEQIHAEGWFTALGVSETASIDEVKEAYKILIKQTHPDRLHDMSPAIRQFAEAETKRLNVAYEEALAELG